MYIGTQITDEEWQRFMAASKALAPKSVHDEDDSKKYAAIVVRNALFDIIDKWLAQGPYRAIGSKAQGYHVYFCEEDKPPRLMDDEDTDKPHDQSYATKKAKRHNRKWNKAMIDMVNKVTSEQVLGQTVSSQREE